MQVILQNLKRIVSSSRNRFGEEILDNYRIKELTTINSCSLNQFFAANDLENRSGLTKFKIKSI